MYMTAFCSMKPEYHTPCVCTCELVCAGACVHMRACVEARGQPVAQTLPAFCFDTGSLTGVEGLQLASLHGRRADLSAFLAQGLHM